MDKPPDHVGEAYPECSDGPGAPVADLSLAVLWGLIGFGIWTDSRDQEGDIGNDEQNAIATMAVATALHAGSAAFGVKWMSECEHKRALWERDRVRYTRPSDSRPTTEPPPAPPRPRRGGEGEPCYPNDTCNAGFACDLASTTCRAAPPVPAPAPTPAPEPAPSPGPAPPSAPPSTSPPTR
jgi:hypothetical protein